MMEVSLFLPPCAIKFLLTKVRMLDFSQNRNRYSRRSSMRPWWFVTNRGIPTSSPTKMSKNIYRIIV